MALSGKKSYSLKKKFARGLDKSFNFDYPYTLNDADKVSGNSSVVERDLAKVDVASSNLVSRSIYFVAA